MTPTVYVPASESELRERIVSGSGIVGSAYGETERLRIDFEGNLYELDELEDYEERVKRAAERHQAHKEQGYSTSACAYVDPDEVIAVGSFDPAKGQLEIGRPEVLEAWLSDSSEPRS